MSNPEIVRLQIELAWAQRSAAEMKDALTVVLDAADLYRRLADMWELDAFATRDRENYTAEQNRIITAMNDRQAARLEAAGLSFDVDGPMDDLRLVDAQIEALTKHRARLLHDQAERDQLVTARMETEAVR
jgi:hypothetical protein